MKKLTIAGHGGVLLSETLVNVEGDDFSLALTIPIFMPVAGISLLEIDKKETKRIKSIIESVEGIIKSKSE